MKTINKIAAVLLIVCGLASCRQEIDNAYSRHNFVIEIGASAQTVVLDEAAKDETALVIDWTPAVNYGNDYIIEYTYKMEVSGSKGDAIVEYDDEGKFGREYTNADLQKQLTEHFGMLTSSYCDVRFTITATFSGPTLIIPDEASVNVRVKTYGAKQFEADELYLNGSAFEAPLKLSPSENNARLYVWTGTLAAGKIWFPVVYGDENNAIIPASETDTDIESTPMAATVVDAAKANAGWKIATADEYRVTVNFDTKTVTIIPTSEIVEIEKIYLGGSAAPEAEIEVAQTLENPSVYAFRGELKEGDLYLPILFGGKTEMSLVPASGDDIHDGEASAYTQIATSAAQNGKHWTIPAAGVYRIVLDIDAKTVTFRSAATDLKNTEVSYNNTVAGINPYTQEVTELWMWGTFNNFGTDAGMKTGFQSKYTLKQSLANPNIFIYKGSVLPRNTATDSNDKKAQAAGVNFKVSNIENNVYSYGSTADAVRNDHSGYTDAVIGNKETLTEGQSHNRYAYFRIPENCNYVEVDIEKMTVVFDKRD
ncbi:MAG: SusE domain-containing protein [Alistipes sp.]|nr:SusE domain-containing protein [Alistipes sp.]